MVFEVSKIDDIALSLTFELYFDLRWRETRLIINDRDDGRRERKRVITPWKSHNTTKHISASMYQYGCNLPMETNSAFENEHSLRHNMSRTQQSGAPLIIWRDGQEALS